MSAGLMSCVRENSPPLELDMSTTTGPLSLPVENTKANMMPGAVTSTPVTHVTGSHKSKDEAKADTTGTPSAGGGDQQKRRRFHPLRNLRRIFRRRTITSGADTTGIETSGAIAPGASNTLPTPTLSSSEKNLRSVTLSAISSVTSASASVSVSPSNSTPSKLPQQDQQAADTCQRKSLSKSKSYSVHQDELLSVVLGKKKNKYTKIATTSTPKEGGGVLQHDFDNRIDYEDEIFEGSQQQQSLETQMHGQRQSVGVAVFPNAMNRSFYAERQKMRSIGDSSQDIDSSGNESGHNTNSVNCTSNGGEMTDNQRSISMGRLIDSEYTRDALSQSHDSVFSESATASSLSIVLKAELADALRKRRNRPDASDEDLGLPRSPASPQRRAINSINSTGINKINQPKTVEKITPLGIVDAANSSSLLSVNSSYAEDVHTKNNSIAEEMSLAETTTESSQTQSEQSDEVDRVSSERQFLSHAAARHKMAIRPLKKNVPSRQARRMLGRQTPIPEANEDNVISIQLAGNDGKGKTNPQTQKLHKDTTPTKPVTVAKRTKTIVSTRKDATNTKSITVSSIASTGATNIFNLRSLTEKASSLLRESVTDDEPTKEQPAQSVETIETGGFLRRLMHRNSKRNIAKVQGSDSTLNLSLTDPKKLQISTSCLEATNREPLSLLDKSRSATSYEQNIEETRKTIRREINNEGKCGLNAMINSFGLAQSTVANYQQQPAVISTKPKSGAAARQRYVPQELSSPNSILEKRCSSSGSLIDGEDVISVTNLLSKATRGNDTFQATTILRELGAIQSSKPPIKPETQFLKKTKADDIDILRQKLSRSNDSFGRDSNSSNSLETSTDEPSPLYYAEKQRKTVEKSRSFRNYQQERDYMNGNLSHTNVPSLPDLSLSFRVPTAYYNEYVLKNDDVTSPMSPVSPLTDRCVSLGFEINDNKLITSPTSPSNKQYTESSLGQRTYNKFKKVTPTSMLNTNTIVPNISPGNSMNITEIEQNIDKIVKSPFVSVLRRSVNIQDEVKTNSVKPIYENNNEKPRKEAIKKNSPSFDRKERPKVLDLKNINKAAPIDVWTPKNAAVPLRDPIKTTENIKTLENAGKHGVERRSAPAVATKSKDTDKDKDKSALSSRRKSITADYVSTDTGSDSQVPEFMKIQLNRVDPARLLKTHNVVLAKNVKDISREDIGMKRVCAGAKTERSYSTDDLSLKRSDSNNSIDILEYTMKSGCSPTRSPNLFFDAINKQSRAISVGGIRSSFGSSNNVCEIVTLKTLKRPNPMQTPITSPCSKSPRTPTQQSADKTPDDWHTKINSMQAKKNLSLEERKRLFLSEEKNNSERKIDELRRERKKSINEELFRKQQIMGTTTAMKTEEIAAEANNAIMLEHVNVTESTISCSNPVVLRKKSFGNIATENNNEPELMKVFARRSLKVKDDEPTVVSNGGQATQLNQATPSIDSDKENQSTSDEKLDMLAKKDAVVVGMASANGNRNSLVDYRNGTGGASNNNKSSSNNNNNNNNNNTKHNSNAVTSLAHANAIKVVNVRANNNNNNNSNNNNVKNNNNNRVSVNTNNNANANNSDNKVLMIAAKERYSLQHQKDTSSSVKTVDNAAGVTASAAASMPKTIERSATVSEFKGIHQRRAEWERRAKEALK